MKFIDPSARCLIVSMDTFKVRRKKKSLDFLDDILSNKTLVFFCISSKMEKFRSLLKKFYLLNKPPSLLFAHYSILDYIYILLCNISKKVLILS